MEENTLITVIRLTYSSELIPYQQALDEAGIKYFIADNIYTSIAPFESNALGGIKVKVRKEDYEEAFEVVSEVKTKKDKPNNVLFEVDYIDDHYLNNYSIVELEKIVFEYDKWSEDDVSYAYSLLKKKGYSITIQEIEAERNKRISQLSESKKGNTWWLVFGYTISVLAGFLNVFFVLVGPLIGWNYYVLKKTLPNGEKVYVYNELTRKRGKILMVIGGFLAVIWIFLYSFYKSSLINLFVSYFSEINT